MFLAAARQPALVMPPRGKGSWLESIESRLRGSAPETRGRGPSEFASAGRELRSR